MSRPIAPTRPASRLLTAFLCAAALVLLVPAPGHAAQPPVDLGGAGTFAVLGGSTVTNTGPSVLTGDLGVSPGSAITGFPPGLVVGATHAADAVAGQAQAALTAAYNDAAGRTPVTSVPADIGGMTLTAGVYNTAVGLGLTGDVTLDAEGDPAAVFIFQAGSTLTTASGSRVLLLNGADPCNVFWQVGSSATLGTATAFNGNVMALTSITATTGATVGRLLARNGAVTLDTNVVTRAPCSADIAVVKSGPATVGAGGLLTWTVQTTNNGPGAATGVQLVDTLPAGTTFVSADPGCTAASGVVTCDIGSLANGATAARQITVQVPGGAIGSTLVNTATGSATQIDDTPANNTATATTQVVASTDLGVTKTGPSQVNAGGGVAWTIVATNNGPSTATGVTVTDPVPAGVTVQSVTPTQGTCARAGQTITCSLGTLTSGSAALIQVVGTVDATATGSLTNTATVTGEQPDTTPANNTATTTATVGPAGAAPFDLSIRKTVLGINGPNVGTVFSYGIDVTNNGPGVAQRVTIIDTVPASLQVRSASVPGGTCDIEGQVVRCVVVSLAAGAKVRATIRVIPTVVGTVRNTATVSASVADQTPGNNTSTVTATVGPQRTTLSVRKRASLATTTPGHTVRYRISVTNTGKFTATRVIVCDVLPSRLSYVSVDGATVRGRSACWTIARLGAGRTRVFHVVARVNRSASPGTTVNVAVVRAGNASRKAAGVRLRIRPGSGTRPAFTG